MNKIQSPWLAALLLIMLSSLSFFAQARILSVQGTNSTSQLGLTSHGNSQITWAVVEEPNAIGQAQVSSVEGAFFDPSREIFLGSSPRLLRQTRPLIGEMNTTFIFQESLVIPQTVIRNAQNRGLNQIIYLRTFQDEPGGTSLSNSVVFSLSASGSSGKVNLRQIQLEFDNGRTSAIIPTNTQLKANAIVSYQGTGLIEYRWEVASPPTTGGQPIFVPLITRREHLMSSGQTTIHSPRLPANMAGTYFLRLNILQTDTQFAMPTLRYFVRSDDKLLADTVVQTMTVSVPPNNAKLTMDTQFVWQPIQGAKAYQVELYAHPIRDGLVSTAKAEKPLTGVIVPASQTSLKMGQVSTTYLNIGSTYFWRVIAISDDGKKIGTSEFRSINY